MFKVIRAVRASGSAQRLFSTTARRNHDVSKLILIGRLGKEPEVKYTTNNKEFMTYTVATTNYPPPPPNPDGSRPSARTSWHTVFCFAPHAFDYLRTLAKGSQVYVEANFELREPDSAAEPGSPQGQRQIFLRQETLRLLKSARQHTEEEAGSSEQ